ncbi:hypothetical protein RMR21_004390 [Agrobacterium sp. rho-8.1]|nr:hypothetical protein [Agrobacterium sp. rho-8.1]
MTDQKRIYIAPSILRIDDVASGNGEATAIQFRSVDEVATVVIGMLYQNAMEKIETIHQSGPLAIITAPCFGVCPHTGGPVRSGFIGTPKEIAAINLKWNPPLLDDLDPEIIPGHESVAFVWSVMRIEHAREAMAFMEGKDWTCVTARIGHGPDDVRCVVVPGQPFQVQGEIDAAKVAHRPLVVWLQRRIGCQHRKTGVPLYTGTLQPLRGNHFANS